MPLSERENYVRNAGFARPEWMPCSISILPASWLQLRGELEDVLARHPAFFPNFRKGGRDFDKLPPRYQAGEYVDPWGCRWRNTIPGIVGTAAEGLLKSWDALDGYQSPDPARFDHMEPIDWAQRGKTVLRQKERGELTRGGIDHGFQFMRLTYLRGFENFMIDALTDEPRLWVLVKMVEDFNRCLVQRWLSLGVDVVHFAEDLGAQQQSLLSPELFAKWIAPSYGRLMQPCRNAGAEVFLHCDGHIMEIMDQLIECGVTIVNPQDRVNGIDNLAREVKGRVCIRLDIDRQRLIPWGTPKEIRNHIEEAVRKLGSREGGLEIHCEIGPPTPTENVEAALCAMEEFRTYWFE